MWALVEQAFLDLDDKPNTASLGSLRWEEMGEKEKRIGLLVCTRKMLRGWEGSLALDSA